MSQHHDLLMLQAIFALAWVDDAFHRDERAYLVGLMDSASLTPEERRQAHAWLDAPPPTPDWAAITQDPALGLALLRQATLLSMLDMSVSAREQAFLVALGARLGLDERAFFALQQDVERELIARQAR